MCGIVGFTGRIDNAQRVIEDMLATVMYRGPDAQACWGNDKCHLAAARLAIQAVETGKQPMRLGNLHLVYNGELYDFQREKDFLTSNGHVFETNGDTEFVLHAYREWGTDCFNKFNGQFAIALYDGDADELVLARDRMGIRPLYYFISQGNIVFASEIKALRKHPGFDSRLCSDAVGAYFTYGYVPQPHTIYREVKSLVPGHFMVFQNHESRTSTYWDASRLLSTDKTDLKGDEVEARVREAVRIRIPSEVDYGIAFSGGTDSTLIALQVAELTGKAPDLYTVRFSCHPRGWMSAFFDEYQYAKSIASALGYPLTTIDMSARDVAGIIEKVVEHHDQPFFDTSSFPFYLMSQRIKADGKKVCFGGDGGDELFCGYYNPATVDPRPGFKSIKQFLNSGLSMFKWDFEKLPLAKFLLPPYNGFNVEGDEWTYARECRAHREHDLNEAMSVILLKTFLRDDLLVKADRMSSAHGLECRVPFLDHRFVSYCFGMDSRVRFLLREDVRKMQFKAILREHLPWDMVERRKKGFSIPSNLWLYYDLCWLVNELTDEAFIRAQGIFNPGMMKELVRRFRATGEWQACILLWAVVMFQAWYRCVHEVR